jgi:hypothetical protein
MASCDISSTRKECIVACNGPKREGRRLVIAAHLVAEEQAQAQEEQEQVPDNRTASVVI